MSEFKGLSEREMNELCLPTDEDTKDFVMQQVMYRIKDPRISLPFYTGILGMTLLVKGDFENGSFSLYFLGYEDKKDIPEDNIERIIWARSQKGIVELTHNWGTENDEKFPYVHGTAFGHIGLKVPDVYAACERFEKLGVQFHKKPDDGRMMGLGFIKDPDGYLIEIFNAETI